MGDLNETLRFQRMYLEGALKGNERIQEGQAVAQAKLEALIEAAAAVTETRAAYRGAFARVSAHPNSTAAAQAEDDLGALLEEKIDGLERAIAEARKGGRR